MASVSNNPVRKHLPHTVPSWVDDGACYFITICSEPRGSGRLIEQGIAEAIANSFRHNIARGIWRVELLLVMPDHLHALMRFTTPPGILKSIMDWKHYTSRTLTITWQRDFFEHRLRDSENRNAKAHYIRMNPVRAGLKARPEDWPFVWTFDDCRE